MKTKCDFCGQSIDVVKRVALAEDYDRLTVPHKTMYACQPCHEAKERERLNSSGETTPEEQ
jgi:hypothetical protein